MRRPTLFGEPASVRQHYTAVALPVDVGVDDTTVLCRKRNAFLRARQCGQEKSRYGRFKGIHGASVRRPLQALDRSLLL